MKPPLNLPSFPVASWASLLAASKFLPGAIHEINNHLTILAGQVELMASGHSHKHQLAGLISLIGLHTQQIQRWLRINPSKREKVYLWQCLIALQDAMARCWAKENIQLQLTRESPVAGDEKAIIGNSDVIQLVIANLIIVSKKMLPSASTVQVRIHLTGEVITLNLLTDLSPLENSIPSLPPEEEFLLQQLITLQEIGLQRLPQMTNSSCPSNNALNWQLTFHPMCS